MKKWMFVLILLSIEGAFAISGISPGSYEIDFRSFLEKNFTFNFIFDEGVVSYVYVEGDLSEYVFLDKTEISGSEKVVATLKIPDNVEIYGLNKLIIGAKQKLGNSEGIKLISDARGIIKVFVPYPGKNVKVELNVPNGNVGERLKVGLKIINQGNESVLASPIVQIFKEESRVANLNFKSVLIESLASSETYEMMNTSEMSSGVYGAVALIDYGGERFAREEDFFKLGEFFVDIIKCSKEINKTDLARFDFEVESFWNNEINDLYAEVSLGSKVFGSPIIHLKSWEKKNITIFVDSSEIKGKEVTALITLYYGGKTTSKIISLKLLNSQKNLYILLLVLLVILVLFIIYWKIVRE